MIELICDSDLCTATCHPDIVIGDAKSSFIGGFEVFAGAMLWPKHGAIVQKRVPSKHRVDQPAFNKYIPVWLCDSCLPLANSRDWNYLVPPRKEEHTFDNTPLGGGCKVCGGEIPNGKTCIQGY